MVSEYLGALPRGRPRLRARLQRLAQLLAARREQAPVCRQPVLPPLQEHLCPARKLHPRRAAHPRRHRVQPKEVGHTPPRHHEHASAKANLRRAEGRETQPTPDRALKPNDLSPRRDRANLKVTLAHASRVPTLNNLMLTNPLQAKKRLEHVIARKQANAKAVGRPSNLNRNSKS